MFCFRSQLEQIAFAPGIILTRLGEGEKINAVHWYFEDGAIVALHQHPQEQFGYVIQGGFDVTIGGETHRLGAGDAYFVPANTLHKFVAVGKTEAIDVFTPIRRVG